MASESEDSEITNLVGREVYTINGVYVGEVDDLQLTLTGGVVNGLALGMLNDDVFEDVVDTDSEGVIIPYRWVRSVGDIVLVVDNVERLIAEEEEEEESTAA